jgi:HD-like signal output (HDOD) protein
MGLGLTTLFFPNKAAGVAGKPKFRPEVVASPASAQPIPCLALCAPPEIRECFSASTKFKFIPHGKADPAILSGIEHSEMAGILIHFEAGTTQVQDFIAVAGKDFPDLPCFILCNLNDQREVSQYGWQVIAVRDLTSLSEIEEKLQRALFLFPWMRCDVLRKILAAIKTIPAESASHQRIARELQNPQFSLEHIAKLIKQDPALTAQLLKIVNSAAFFRTSPVQNVDEAVTIVGAMKLQALVLSAWAFFLIDDGACAGFHPKNEWKHAMEIAERVRVICKTEQVNTETTETAIIAALLHDLGKLLLAANLPRDYALVLQRVESDRSSCSQVEDQMLGFNHAQVAGCLLALWGVSLPVAEAVLYHHADGLAAGSPAALIQKAHAHENDPSCQQAE